MSDDLGALAEAIGTVGEWFAGSASALAFVAYLTEFVRGRGETRSFRPLGGWITAVLGAAAVGAAVVTLQERGLQPWAPGGRLLGTALLVGIALVLLGASTALLTPSVDLPALREIAGTSQSALRREPHGGAAMANCVELDLEVADKPAWSGDAKISRVRRLSTTRLPTASVTVVAGPAGSGKSVVLAQFTAALSRRVLRTRRPREVAVHVSLPKLPPVSAPVDRDTIREHLVASVAKDDSVLGAKFQAYLDGGGGPRWVFVFDLGAEMTRDREVEYFEALRNFMRHRDRDRAVVAVRTRFPDARPVFAVRRPDRVQIREIMRKRGISVPDRVLPRDPDLADLLATPEMVARFAVHVVDRVPGAGSVDVVESFIGNHLDRHTTLSRGGAPLRERAEETAYRVLAGIPGQDLPPEDLGPLLTAGLGRVERGAFAFRFPVVGVHLAAGHAIRRRLALPVAGMARTGTTRALLTAVLRRADEEYAASLVRAIEAVVDEWGAGLGTTRSDALPPLGSFWWSPEVLHLLGVLRDAVRWRPGLLVSARLRDRVDALTWLAMFGGGRHERDAALGLLPMASPLHVLALHRQAKSLGYNARTTTAVALHAVQGTEGPTHLERLVMLNDAIRTWRTAPLPLGATVDGKPLARMIQALVATAAATAAGWGITLCAVAIALDEADQKIGCAAVAAVLFGMSARLFTRVSAPGRAEAVLVNVLVYLGILMCLIPTLLFVQAAVVALFTLNVLSLFRGVFFAWAFTWPPAMVAAVVHNPLGPHPWVLPHSRIAALARGSREEWIGHVDRVRDRLGILRSAPRVAALVLIASVAAVLPVDLPVRGEVEQSIDYPVAMGLVVALILLLRERQVKAEPEPADVVGRQIFTGETTGVRLLAEIGERAGNGLGGLLHLFKALEGVPPPVLRNYAPVLRSLDGLLEFLEHMLPAPTNSTASAIPPGLWRYAPQVDPPELLAWAKDFDRHHGGDLHKLANSERHRALLSRAIHRATAEFEPAAAGAGVLELPTRQQSDSD